MLRDGPEMFLFPSAWKNIKYGFKTTPTCLYAPVLGLKIIFSCFP
jgi:hypothetical protein